MIMAEREKRMEIQLLSGVDDRPKNMKLNKPILDACCGGKMFYFDKSDDRVLFQDIRKFKTTLCDGRPFEVDPDVQCDFTKMPYKDETFQMVVFDPPHLVYSSGKNLKWMISTALLVIRLNLQDINKSNMAHYILIGVICFQKVLKNVLEFLNMVDFLFSSGMILI